MRRQSFFAVIGAAKAATTSLYQYLRDHPEIQLSSVKEPRFLLYDGRPIPMYAGPGDGTWLSDGLVTDWHQYLRLLDGDEQTRVVGECSTDYLASAHATSAMYRRFPEAKVVAILRHPVDRAYSNYRHQKRDGYETRGFVDALRAERSGERNSYAPHWHYVERGLYAKHLERYIGMFGRSRVYTIRYEDFRTNPLQELAELLRFLEVEAPSYPLNTDYWHNRSAVPRDYWTNRLSRASEKGVLSALKSAIPRGARRRVRTGLEKFAGPDASLGVQEREQAMEFFADDIGRLSTVVGADFSDWLAV